MLNEKQVYKKQNFGHTNRHSSTVKILRYSSMTIFLLSSILAIDIALKEFQKARASIT